MKSPCLRGLPLPALHSQRRESWAPLAEVWGCRRRGQGRDGPPPFRNLWRGSHFPPPSSVQSSRHSKLEKADILEMTVKHLRNLQRAQMTESRQLPRPLCGRLSRPAVIFFRLPPVVVRGIQLHFTALAHSCVHGLGLIYSHNSKLLLFRKGRRGCSGEGGGRRAAWQWGKRMGGGGERLGTVVVFKLRGAWGHLVLRPPRPLHKGNKARMVQKREGHYPRSHRAGVGRRQI